MAWAKRSAGGTAPALSILKIKWSRTLLITRQSWRSSCLKMLREQASCLQGIIGGKMPFKGAIFSQTCIVCICTLHPAQLLLGSLSSGPFRCQWHLARSKIVVEEQLLQSPAWRSLFLAAVGRTSCILEKIWHDHARDLWRRTASSQSRGLSKESIINDDGDYYVHIPGLSLAIRMSSCTGPRSFGWPGLAIGFMELE